MFLEGKVHAQHDAFSGGEIVIRYARSQGIVITADIRVEAYIIGEQEGVGGIHVYAGRSQVQSSHESFRKLVTQVNVVDAQVRPVIQPERAVFPTPVAGGRIVRSRGLAVARLLLRLPVIIHVSILAEARPVVGRLAT